MAVIVVEALGGEEDLTTIQARGPDRLSHLGLVAICGSSVEVAVTGLQGLQRDLLCLPGRDLEDAEAELWDLRAAAEGYAGDVICLHGHARSVARLHQR
jgi:hypothetical protein